MKILFPNPKQKHLIEPQYAKEIKGENVKVKFTTFFDIIINLRSYFLGKVVFKLLPSLVYYFCNRQLLKDVDHHKPDVVVIFKGMEIFPKTLKKLKRKQIFLVNYNQDHPFTYCTKATGNSNVKKSIPLFDLHVTYSRFIQNEMNQKYPKVHVEVLPFGYDTEIDNLKIHSKDIKKVCFIGHADQKRASVVEFLLNQGLEIDVYGEKWHKFLKASGQLSIGPSLFGHTYWQTLADYRVQLNIFRPHNHLSHNMRSFEVPAVGGIMLSERTPEQMEFFRDGKEAFYFEGKTDLVNKLNRILSLSKAEADLIRRHAREKSKQESYGYRAEQLLAFIAHHFKKSNTISHNSEKH